MTTIKQPAKTENPLTLDERILIELLRLNEQIEDGIKIKDFEMTFNSMFWFMIKWTAVTIVIVSVLWAVAGAVVLGVLQHSIK